MHLHPKQFLLLGVWGRALSCNLYVSIEKVKVRVNNKGLHRIMLVFDMDIWHSGNGMWETGILCFCHLIFRCLSTLLEMFVFVC